MPTSESSSQCALLFRLHEANCISWTHLLMLQVSSTSGVLTITFTETYVAINYTVQRNAQVSVNKPVLQRHGAVGCTGTCAQRAWQRNHDGHPDSAFKMLYFTRIYWMSNSMSEKQIAFEKINLTEWASHIQFLNQFWFETSGDFTASASRYGNWSRCQSASRCRCLSSCHTQHSWLGEGCNLQKLTNN